MTPAASPLYLQIMTVVAGWRATVHGWLTGLSFWPDIVVYSRRISAPVVAIAHWALRTMPWLRRAEWLFEVQTLTLRHPVALAFSICYASWSGLMPTLYGHIATDITIYPFLAAVSGFNPFLGLLCGASYGVFDIVQKLLWNDIFQDSHGTASRFSLNYWGAMAGYVIAYSSTMTMGVLPGFTSRVARLAMRKTMQKLMFSRSAAAADGAEPLDPWRIFVRQRPGGMPELAMSKTPPDASWKPKEGPFTEPECWNRISALAATNLYEVTTLPVNLPHPAKVVPPVNTAYQPSKVPPPLNYVEPGTRGTGGAGTGGIDPRRCATAEGAYPLHEMVAGFFGGAIAGMAGMAVIAPRLEAGVFYLRPQADDSCFRTEVTTYLVGKSPLGGLGGGIGGLGPNITPPPSSTRPGSGQTGPAVPDIGALVTRYNSVNVEVSDPGLTARLQGLIDKYHQTGTLDPAELASIENAQAAIRQGVIARADAGNEQNLDRNRVYRTQQQELEDSDVRAQRALRGQFEKAVAQASGDRGSAAAAALVDPWHDAVVNPDDGTIDPEMLHAMQRALLHATKRTDAAQAALANATSDAADNALAVARGMRDTGAFVLSSVVTGGAAAAGYSASVVSLAMSAAMAGITAKSEGGGFIDGAASGVWGGLKSAVVMGGVGKATGFLTAGLNHVEVGAGLGAVTSGVEAWWNGQDVLSAMAAGGLRGGAGAWLGGKGADFAVRTGMAAAPPPAPGPWGYDPEMPASRPKGSDNRGGLNDGFADMSGRNFGPSAVNNAPYPGGVQPGRDRFGGPNWPQQPDANARNMPPGQFTHVPDEPGLAPPEVGSRPPGWVGKGPLKDGDAGFRDYDPNRTDVPPRRDQMAPPAPRQDGPPAPQRDVVIPRADADKPSNYDRTGRLPGNNPPPEDPHWDPPERKPDTEPMRGGLSQAERDEWMRIKQNPPTPSAVKPVVPMGHAGPPDQVPEGGPTDAEQDTWQRMQQNLKARPTAPAEPDAPSGGSGIDIDPRTAHIEQVRDYLKQDPAGNGHYYINMDASRLAQANRDGGLSPGSFGSICSTAPGSGPQGYTFDNTRVLRIDPAHVVQLVPRGNGQFLDSRGNKVTPQNFPDKVIAVMGPNGVDRELSYVTPDAQVKNSIPNSKLQVWSPVKGEFRRL